MKLVSPVGIKYKADFTAIVCRSKTAIARLLAHETHYASAFLVENDKRDCKAEVLEVLAYSEKIRGDFVVKKEV